MLNISDNLITTFLNKKCKFQKFLSDIEITSLRWFRMETHTLKKKKSKESYPSNFLAVGLRISYLSSLFL